MFQYNQDGDGIDHINCYSKGATLLGRMMSNFYKSKFIVDGKEYYTMEHFWYTHYIEFILNKFPERIEFIDFSNADSIESDLDSMRKIDGYSVKLRCEDLIKDLTMNNNGVSFRINEDIHANPSAFRGKIKLGITNKIIQNQKIYEEFLANELPMCHYYHGKLIVPRHGWLFTDFLGKLARKMREEQ